MVVFFLEVDFFLVVVVVPEAVVLVLASIELEDEDVDVEAAGAGAAVGLGAAVDWAKRPVGRATATPIARMRATDLFISLYSFRRGAKRTVRTSLNCRHRGVNGP